MTNQIVSPGLVSEGLKIKRAATAVLGGLFLTSIPEHLTLSMKGVQSAEEKLPKKRRSLWKNRGYSMWPRNPSVGLM